MTGLKFIVTGTGRCGTVFFAKMLTSIGIPCGHESIFDYADESIIFHRLNNGTNNLSLCSQINDFINKTPENEWVDPKKIIADSSYLAAPYLNHPLLTNVPVIHLIRDPLQVISSYVLDFNYFKYKFPDDQNDYNKMGWENKIYHTLPELGMMDSQVERACYFYIRWNQMIKDSCRFRPYLLIDINNIDCKKMFNFLNIENPNFSNMYNYKKSNSNKEQREDLKETDIPNEFMKLLKQQR